MPLQNLYLLISELQTNRTSHKNNNNLISGIPVPKCAYGYHKVNIFHSHVLNVCIYMTFKLIT